MTSSVLLYNKIDAVLEGSFVLLLFDYSQLSNETQTQRLAAQIIQQYLTPTPKPDCVAPPMLPVLVSAVFHQS